MKTDERYSVIILDKNKETERIIVCENSEDARRFIGNLFDTHRRFEAHVAETFEPTIHLQAAQKGLFTDEDC